MCILQWPLEETEFIYIYIYIYMYICICIEIMLFIGKPMGRSIMISNIHIYIYIRFFIYLCIHAYISTCMYILYM